MHPPCVEKVAAYGNGTGVMVTERGTTFGLTTTWWWTCAGLVQVREFAPVCFDATHSVQRRIEGEEAAGGTAPWFRPPLARAAVAVGVDAMFVEVHPDPDQAPCDGPSQLSSTATRASSPAADRGCGAIDEALERRFGPNPRPGSPRRRPC